MDYFEGRFDGKIVLITGTAGGQGRVAALRFAREGATVVGCDRNVEGDAETVRLVEDAGGKMVSRSPVDLSDEAQMKSWIDFAVSEVGDFDILYNNAAHRRFALVEDMTRREWDYTLENELTLVFLAVKHAVPVFVRKGNGCILNVGSVAAMAGGHPSGFAHGAAKAAVIACTRHWANELAPLNIRVNAIAPGMIDTPSTQYVTTGSLKEAFPRMVLRQRFGRPEDTVAAACFLCSDEASYITGVTLPVDGGVLAGTMPQERVALIPTPEAER